MPRKRGSKSPRCDGRQRSDQSRAAPPGFRALRSFGGGTLGKQKTPELKAVFEEQNTSPYPRLPLSLHRATKHLRSPVQSNPLPSSGNSAVPRADPGLSPLGKAYRPCTNQDSPEYFAGLRAG